MHCLRTSTLASVRGLENAEEAGTDEIGAAERLAAWK